VERDVHPQLAPEEAAEVPVQIRWCDRDSGSLLDDGEESKFY
jgi:hypothetical protein